MVGYKLLDICEPFRHKSYLSGIAVGVIAGLGPIGYELALRAAVQRLASKTN